MKNIISFSLWGEDPKYCVGAIKNVELAKELFPGWVCRFYIGDTVPKDIINTLEENENVEIVLMETKGNFHGMFWRFYAASDPNVDVFLSRDCDSRLSEREKQSINEWLDSDKDFHIMRDHPWHTSKIMGGMWGVRNKKLDYIESAIKMFLEKYKNSTDYYQVDQDFLNQFIYPIVIDTSLVFDEYNVINDGGIKFSTERIGKEFVGEVIDENGLPNEEHRSYIK